MAPFETLRIDEPLARMAKRDATLDGSVPLRVAQACVPMLEGNALGDSIVFDRRVVVRVRLGRKSIVDADAIDRAHRAAVPRLVAEGHLERGGAWAERLERRWWWVERGVLRVWTGLLVRPKRGMWLRVSSAGSRATATARVRPSYVANVDDVFVPLVVDFDAVDDGARLEGTIATIIPVVPAVTAEIVGPEDAEGAIAAHAEFYDAKYFATKKGEVTRKYRRNIARRDVEPAKPPITIRIAHVAGPRPEVLAIDRALGPHATSPVAMRERFEVVRFCNAVAFTANFDGNTLDVVPDRAALLRGGRQVEEAIGGRLGKGALLYLTKYFTPHPHGEPHFFVKPWAFTVTPPGWSSVVDGIHGDGYDVLRGVVWTDRFHATPAVFDLARGRTIRVREGAPLIDVFPVRRA